MTTGTIPSLEEAILAAWDGTIRPHDNLRVTLTDAMTDTAYLFTNALWQRNQACDADDCPNRPAWDRELTAAADAAMNAARDEALALIFDRMAAFAERFQAEHPEAVLREVPAE